MVETEYGFKNPMEVLIKQMGNVELDEDLPEIVDIDEGFINFN